MSLLFSINPCLKYVCVSSCFNYLPFEVCKFPIARYTHPCIAPILPTEVSAAIKRLKRNKAPGNDNITADVLKDGGEPIVQMFTNMFNRCLREGKLPNSWKDASVIIIHKKGDTADIKNYRPISLLPITYKVFSQVILRRMLRTLDQHQPREQAGFRSGFSTIDHIQVITRSL